jgi:hypothetical protein
MEEKTKLLEAGQAQPYPPQEIKSFPKEETATQKEVEGHLLSTLYATRPTTTPEAAAKPTENDKDKQTQIFIRFIRDLAAGNDAQQQEILGRIKGKGDAELLGVVSEIVHGLDVDAQVALTQGQQLAAERQAQVQMATQTEQPKSIWKRVRERFWTQKAA